MLKDKCAIPKGELQSNQQIRDACWNALSGIIATLEKDLLSVFSTEVYVVSVSLSVGDDLVRQGATLLSFAVAGACRALCLG